MATLNLENTALDATTKVASLVPKSAVEDDGGGAYLYVPLTEYFDGEYLVISVPVLFLDEEANWGANTGDHEQNWETEYDVSTDAETVARWVNTIVVPEALENLK